MFQRLKGAIDSRIAEEQARQRLSQASPSRSRSITGRSQPRNISPSRNASRQNARGRQDGAPSAKGPDPGDFESEPVTEDLVQSRSGTPKPPTDCNRTSTAEKAVQESHASGDSSQESGETTMSAEEPRTSSDLPTDVRVKLRKLEKLESRYHELLQSYRVAHARVLTIESFETSLRENTPLTSINDPKALVEYLNQVNLQGDMVVDELKRVSNDRDAFKQKLSEAEKSAKQAWDEVANLREVKGSRVDTDEDGKQSSSSHLENETVAEDSTSGGPLGAITMTPPAPIKSPTNSVRRMSLFSPKSIHTESSKLRQEAQDLFSYDDEVPRLEIEAKDRQTVIEGLENEVRSLRGDLSVTRESTQSMVQTLEEATRELNSLRDIKERSESVLKEQEYASERLSDKLRRDLRSAEDKLKTFEAERSSGDSDLTSELSSQPRATKQELEDALSVAKQDRHSTSKIEQLYGVIGGLESEMSDARAASERSEKKFNTLNTLIATLRLQLTEAEKKNQDLIEIVEKSSKAADRLQEKVGQLEAQSAKHQVQGEAQPDETLNRASGNGPQNPTSDMGNLTNTSNGGKKKSKKRKKGGKSSSDQGQENLLGQKQDPGASVTQPVEPLEPVTLSRLQDELRQLPDLLDEKDAAIDRIHRKLKDQDGLREEIDTLRDDLVNVGQEHVEAKDKVKELSAEKITLQDTVTSLERELTELRNADASNAAGSEQKHKDLAVQFEGLKLKATTLQTDLSAAQQLASSRFKDLSDLRNILQKAQPEINVLRSEAAEVKSVKEALAKKDADFKRYDSRHEEMRSEVTGLKTIITERELDIGSLYQKLNQESSSRLQAEDASSKANQEVHRLDSERRRATESLDRLSTELEKAREELSLCRTRLKDSEQQLSKVRSDSEGFKEEIELKTAQYASAQSLMASMRDQTAEMAMQMKEARERCESLDEEIADAHRLLGERSREGETMRRLLADVESRADARTREMKERMDTAIEERDRAEDEASTAGRRKARELEDLKNKYRDVERNLKRAEEDKEELEFGQRDWKRRREELEHRAGQSTKEVEEVQTAMGDLRDTLDESERQVRELEKQKAELRRSVEDTQRRLEKLQKSNKLMADEISKFQTAKTRSMDAGAQSSRSSQDSVPRIGSPAPRSSSPSVARIEASNGQPQGAMDYVYLKNVLLQFLEQKDKKHQVQLIPVLGMLLHFDRKDEQKWMSAITLKS